MDVARGVGRAQGCVSPVCQRIVQMCLLRDRAERLHGWGAQIQVAVTTGDYELGVAGSQRCVLRDGVLGRRPVRFVQQRVAVVGGGPENQNGCPVCCSRTRRLSRSHTRGIPLTTFAAPAGTLVARSRSACPRRWRMTSASTVWCHCLWMRYGREREAATPSPSGKIPEMATAHVQVRSAARATLVTCLHGPPPDASEDVWPQASGIQ